MGAARKPRVVFVCQACGQQSPKWLGRCPGCQAWSSLVEELQEVDIGDAHRALKTTSKPVALADIVMSQTARISTGIAELDRVLGGGLVEGALMLVGGDPGIGKSTLLLQTLANLANQGSRALYVTAEESLMQVKLRADRLQVAPDKLYLLAETEFSAVEEAQKTLQPTVMVIDSIQTVGLGDMSSAVGSVAQIRAVTAKLLHMAKNHQVATFVVGHVTKDGMIAGPKVMEHMVDTVLYFEGDRTGPYRILRAHKNRFGSASEIGVFEMLADGLQPVSNPSELFLSQRACGPGAAVATSLQGSRPILLEVQALVTPSAYGGTPRRTATGFDGHRLAMLCAVLGARAGIDLSAADVFVNVAGGLRISEPAADLAVVLALASAACNIPIPADMVAVGEVGLAGEIRPTTQLAQRLQEAAALGFKQALCPKIDPARMPKECPVLHTVGHVREALAACQIRPKHKTGKQL